MERLDELRGDDTDDAAVPALAGHDQHGPRADLRVGLDDLLRRGENACFLLLTAQVLGVELQRQRARLSPSVSSLARSSRVAISGLLMRPAALTRGASMNEM